MTNRIFFWCDLASGSRNGLITDTKLWTLDNDMGVRPPLYNYEISLHDWLVVASQGEEWYNATDSYTCVGTFEDFEKLKSTI